MPLPIHPLDAVDTLPLDPGAVSSVGVTQAAISAVAKYGPVVRSAKSASGEVRQALVGAASRLAWRTAIAHAQRYSSFVRPSAADPVIECGPTFRLG